MRELLWWINFTCKWQNVSLRTLCFTPIFEVKNIISLQEMQSFETFYNHSSFQQISMMENFSRWGKDPSPNNYKMALRTFIKKLHPTWSNYTDKKVKVGSLYNVVKHRHYSNTIINFDTKTQEFYIG